MEKENTCKCGYKIDDYRVERKIFYSKFGWFLYGIGMSAKPIKVIYQCNECGTIIKEITEEIELKKFVGR